MPPLVSVIIPAYNAAPWIADTVRSVLDQSFLDLEVIVVDDGSTDATASVLRTLTDPRLRVIQQKNGGVSSARNKGLDAASGTYIAFLDADDAMEHTNIAEKLEAISERGTDWVFGDLILCNEHLEPTGRVLSGTDGDVVRTILLGIDTAVPAMCSNALLKRSCFDGGYRFPPHLSNAADQHFALAMAHKRSHHHLPRALNRYRVLKQSMSRNVALYEADQKRLFNEARQMGLLQEARFARTCNANLQWSIGGSWWINGKSPLRALPYLLRAVLSDPSIVIRRFKRSERRGTH